MRILLTAKYVPSGRVPKGGVQSWITTIRKEFEALGHTCEEWEPGFPTPTGMFDLGLIAHHTLTGHLGALCGRSINITHGIIEAERPAPLGVHDDIWAVSEGVRNAWGLAAAQIVRQPIDLDFWTPVRKEPDPIVFRWSYRHDPIKGGQLARRLGSEYRHGHNLPAVSGRDMLRRSQLVLASGRGALEAMACGAPTLIYDHRGEYQGELFDPLLSKAMTNSYSGRGGYQPDIDSLEEAAHRALAAPPDWWRDWVKQFHDSKKIARGILA